MKKTVELKMNLNQAGRSFGKEVVSKAFEMMLYNYIVKNRQNVTLMLSYK